MNDQISWDPSLVKKFSSSNHFKLLNQLRSEVKKYPLNNKRHLSSNVIKDSKGESSNNSNIFNSSDPSYPKNSNITKVPSINQTSVSFNNSKNFSIYNNTNNDNSYYQKESSISDENKIKEDSVRSSFNDRLNHIDMK